MIERIVSGAQTGVDRGALDAALELGVACGGWCPRARRAEDGTIPERYPVEETGSEDYAERTERNVVDSDATLVLSKGPLTGGTALTVELARRHGRPVREVELGEGVDPGPVMAWANEHGVRTLNVAGSRESTRPGIQAEARAFVCALLVLAGASDGVSGG